MFEWLENTSLAVWVGESIWGYPVMLGTHAVGLAIVVGIFLMLDLRILSLNQGVSFTAFQRLFSLAWVGLLINALSGAALFSSQAATFVESAPFLIKIGCIVLGVILALLIRRELKKNAADWDARQAEASGLVRPIAALSIICWLAAICAGRLIAYL
jgi:hypothetical protein